MEKTAVFSGEQNHRVVTPTKTSTDKEEATVERESKEIKREEKE